MLPSDNQLKFATDIAEKLKIKLPPQAIKDARGCGNFITKHKVQFYKAIGSAKVQIGSTDTAIPEQNNVEKAPSNAKNDIKEIKKDTFEQKVINYWQDGLERTAFDGYGNLETELQGVQSFSFDKTEFVLKQFLCKNVSETSSAQQTQFVRHLVMLLEPEKAQSNNFENTVIYVFPLALKFDESKDSEIKKVPYSWVKATDEIPLFNHRIMGEEAEVEGLMLTNKEAFGYKMASVEAILADGSSLDRCLNFIDQCFDALTDGEGGCKAWIEKYKESKNNVAWLRNKEVRFKLVDGSAVAGATKNIRNCFSDLSKVVKQTNHGLLPLFKNIINKNKDSSKAFTADQEKLTWDNLSVYLGHMDSISSNKKRTCYPLDPSQRISLSLFKKINNGNTLAVNGPPGTGKTSLLRAVIADEWIRPLISNEKNPECPILVACAATNQAVTNIISSFDSVPGPRLRDIHGERTEYEVCIESRWIPHLVSYGWYQPASVNKDKVEYHGFQIITRRSPSRPWEFEFAAKDFGKVVNNISYLEYSYLSLAKEFFNESLEVAEVAQLFRNKINEINKEMVLISDLLKSWSSGFVSFAGKEDEILKYKNKYEHLKSTFDIKAHKQSIATYDREIKRVDNKLLDINTFKNEVRRDFEPSLFQRILRKAIGYLRKSEERDNKYWLNRLDKLGISLSEKDVNLNEILHFTHKKTQTLLLKKNELIQERNASYNQYKENTDFIKQYETSQAELEQLQTSLKDSQGEIVCKLEDLTGRSQVQILERFIYAINCTKSHLPLSWNDFYITLLQDIQDILDIYVRPKLFHLSARYWEARYILYRKQVMQLPNHRQTSIEKIRELAMLAPVFVTTSYSAPKLMKCIDSNRLHDYLYDQADLLIVDEAGQGTPEIGACVFSFAKRAIVVGDTEQIKPVWNIEQSIDSLIQGHLKMVDDKELLKKNGLMMSSGSIMLMAQNATQFYDENKTVPGVMLTNHYRCRNPIIQICNEMVYSGALNVVEAATEPKKEWRAPLGFLVVPGESTKLNGGSRCNLAEAALIAKWLKEQESSILSHYNSNNNQEGLADLVALLTPFKGQVYALRKAIANEFSEDLHDKSALANQLVVGTVHSLQGSERPIVIFSMVESVNPGEKHFYDEDSSLINVAISRAKEVFIIALDQKAVNYGHNLNRQELKKPSDYLFYHMMNKGKRLNSNELMLIESPHKREHLQKALGKGMELKIIATNGHLTQLDTSSSWDPITATEPKWTAISDKEAHVYERVALLWSDLDTLYIATDPDAEGESIAWHFINRVKAFLPQSNQQKNMPTIKRMRFYNLRDEEIQDAYVNASDGLDAGLVKGSLFRAFLDQIISRHYPKKLGLGVNNNFHAGIGRVQLSILGIAQKYLETEDEYCIEVKIPNAELSNLGNFILYDNDENKPMIFNDPLIANKAAIKLKSMVDKKGGITVDWQATVQQLLEYPALNTAQFLKLACTELELSPTEVMNILQALYEGLSTVKDDIEMEQLA
jgi:superfamily I DNA and/or RNA helicase